MKVRSVAAASVVGVMMSVAHAALAVDYEFTWDAANPQTSFGDGLVTLTLDESTVTAMHVAAETGDTVTFTGDPMAFAADAEVSVARGVVVFANDVNAAGDISFVTADKPADWIEAGTGLYNDIFTKVLENTKLSDIEVVKGHLSANGNGDGFPYFVTRGEGWMEFQLQQYLGSGNSTKVVKVRLEQQGEDIAAKLLYAKYVSGKDALGIDFDKPSDLFTIVPYSTPSSTSLPQYYYGVNQLYFQWLSGDDYASAKVSGAWTCAGKVHVGDRMTFGTLNRPQQTIDGLELDNGVLKIEADEDASDVDFIPFERDGYQPNAWTVLAENMKLTDLDGTSIAGKLAGSDISSTPVDAVVCFFGLVPGSTTVYECQFQAKVNSSLTKGILIKFRQQGNNVEFAPAGQYYNDKDPGERSFRESETQSGGSYAAGIDQTGYCIAGISAHFKVGIWASSVTLLDGGTTEAGVIEVKGASDAHAELRITTTSGLPTNATVKVGQNGILSVIVPSANMNTGISGGTAELYIGPGGKLRQGGNSSFPSNFSYTKQHVTVDGGEAEFGCECTTAGSTADPVDTSGSTYLNFLTLMNGARCYGKAVRLGNHNAKWEVSGTSPSTWDASISLLATSGNGQATVEFAVADATSSDDPDFIVNGDMKMFYPGRDGYKYLHVVKSGGGTMKVNGVTDFTVYPLKVTGGTWMVGSATTMSTAQNVQLEGGSFASADGVSASVGKLLVGGAGGGIVAGANATVSFLDSSDQTWLGTVNITCPEGSSVRFGTSASALTTAQQRKLRLNGKRAVLSDDGTVELRIGTLLILR